MRIKELRQAIEVRKKMMKEIGFGNGGDKRLEEKLKVARARYAELQAKVAKEQQLKTQQEWNADSNAKSEPKKESKQKPKKRSAKSKRSSSQRRTSSRK